jgi:tetratricopeptide (TPR) repeat protein
MARRPAHVAAKRMPVRRGECALPDNSTPRRRWQRTAHVLVRAALQLCLAAAPVRAAAPGDIAAEGLGKVSFANSCSAAVQPAFARAVALLHSFWFLPGGKAFADVLARDPDCAIATWGIAAIAMRNPFGGGPPPAEAQTAQEALAHGRALGAKATERERGYIEAISAYYDAFSERSHRERLNALAAAFADLAARFPDDEEAQIFHALYLMASQDPADRTHSTALAAADILQGVFTRHRDHPGVAFYLIHGYDNPAIADKGLEAARAYADIAPSLPYDLHMPSHIFTRVGAWRESVATNQRAAAASKRLKNVNEQLHVMDYAVYADLQLARDVDARAMVEEASRIDAPDPAMLVPSHAWSAMLPARYVVERSAWSEAAQLQPTPSRYPYTTATSHYGTAITYFARALGAARSGDAAAAEKDVHELAKIVDALRSANIDYWATEVQVQRLGAAAWTAFAKGNRDEAVVVMRAAAEMEDQSDKPWFTPARLVPARELLGDMLIEIGKPKEALAEYEASLVREPKRFRGVAGAALAAAQSGNRDKARFCYRRLLEIAGAGETRPELAKAREYLAGE